MRRTTISLTMLLLLTLSCKGGKKDEQYKTEKVDRGSVTMTITATGTLSAVTTVQIGSQVSGVIARLYADFNSRVTKGQLLAELDPTPFEQQVAQRQADVTKANVDAANAKITYERQHRLNVAGLAAQADLDAARAAYDGARAEVQQAVAALSQAKTNLTYTKINSPIDGIVVDREYDVGQTVAASFQAPVLFSIAQDLTKMQVQADVDQSDIGRVQVGQIARFTVDAYPDEEFRGKISQIRLNATVTQNVVTYPVIIEVPNPGERLRPKMTANVTIDVATVQDVLRIPNAALRFKPPVTDAAATTSRGTGGGAGRGPRSETSTSSTASSSTSETTTTTTTVQTTSQSTSTTGSSPQGGGWGGRAGGGGHHHRDGAGGAGGFANGAAATGTDGGIRPAPAKAQLVYTLGADGKPVAAHIRTGITDGRYTQVVSGDLKLGDAVIVGLATSKVESTTTAGSSPFGGGGPPGGGGQRGGGGGRGR